MPLLIFMIRLTEPLHHAYGVSPNGAGAVPEILSALERAAGFVATGNPDFREERFEVMGIDEARVLKEAAGRTAMTGGKKIFIVSVRGITKQAQNALLKILEEPPSETHFFLIVPSPELLLPTLRSRLSMLRASDSRSENQMLAELPSAEEFLAKSPSARIAVVQAMLKALEKEKDDKEDSTEPLVEKERIMQFLSALERTLAGNVRQNATALSELLEVKTYARDRAPSLKLLLEHVALSLPKKLSEEPPLSRGLR